MVRSTAHRCASGCQGTSHAYQYAELIQIWLAGLCRAECDGLRCKHGRCKDEHTHNPRRADAILENGADKSLEGGSWGPSGTAASATAEGTIDAGLALPLMSPGEFFFPLYDCDNHAHL